MTIENMTRSPVQMGRACTSLFALTATMVLACGRENFRPVAAQTIQSPAPMIEPEGTPGRVACGDLACDVSKDVCCGGGDAGAKPHCIARASLHDGEGFPNEERDDREYLVAKRTCASPNSKHSTLSAKTCDESSDCPAGTICCTSSVGGMSRWDTTRCARIDQCDTVEICSQGTCRTPGSTCVNSVCAAVSVRIQCGQEVCTAVNRYCHVNEKSPEATHCSASAVSDRKSDFRLACASQRDCTRGSYCNVHFTSTYCAPTTHGESSTITCETDADCKVQPLTGLGEPHCEAEVYSGYELRVCRWHP